MAEGVMGGMGIELGWVSYQVELGPRVGKVAGTGGFPR